MKKTKHSEEKIIGAVKQTGSRTPGEGSGARDGRHRPDPVQLEVEVRRDGRERREAAEGTGRREPATEESGGRSEPGQRSADDGDPKKRLELVSARRDVALVMAEHGLAERYACRLLEVDRSTYRYEPRPDRNAKLREALLALARQQPRYGYRRLWALLVRQGWEVDVKRVHRLYKAEGLMVRRLKRKRVTRSVPVNPLLVRPKPGVGHGFRFRCAGHRARAADVHPD